MVFRLRARTSASSFVFSAPAESAFHVVVVVLFAAFNALNSVATAVSKVVLLAATSVVYWSCAVVKIV